MTTQPEALRLAEWIEGDMTCQGDAEIATELRRLHDEVQQLKSDLSEEVLISNEMLEVNAELLAALKMALEAPDDDRSWEDDAIAAIKTADPLWVDPRGASGVFA